MEPKAGPAKRKSKKPAKNQLWLSKIRHFSDAIYYAFPVQLLVNHFKTNQVLLLCWILLFAIVTENFGKVFGIPYLFLDPEYMQEVSFWSFFIIGIALGGFIMAFHITSYIMDGPKFSFLGMLPRPFTKFTINNGIVPALFLIIYIGALIRFQSDNGHNSMAGILLNVSGLLAGCMAMFVVLYSYFQATNKDIFKFVVAKVDKRLRKARLARGKLMHRYKHAKKEAVRVDNYLDVSFRVQPAIARPSYLDKAAILKVFDQNHFNSVIIELFVFVALLLLGIFREIPLFQIPAAASALLLFMFAGAISFWFKSWAASSVIVLILIFNVLVEKELVTKIYKAYGLDYDKKQVDYSLSKIASINSLENYEKDIKATLEVLENWKKKQNGTKKPKMVFVCASGGGQRSSLWTLKALQAADSITAGRLMQNTFLMTGASGGIIGSAYYRELYLRKQLGEDIQPNDPRFLANIGQDILNPLIFSLVVNDIFIRYQNFEYMGMQYSKDRGYAFEQQLNKNTGGFLDKRIQDYAEAERESIIPMMIMAPVIVNDGRKLYISPHHVSYLNLPNTQSDNYFDAKIKGMDFGYLFEGHGAKDLRFLTALRMSATFPYITPNITLPSSPAIEIMDAGLSDNFGITDALNFLSVFRTWIHENTSGVVILSIRDSEKNPHIDKRSAPSFFEKIITPARSLYNNWVNIQDINNDNQVELAKLWFEGEIDRIDLEYTTSTMDDLTTKPLSGSNEKRKAKEIERASLSWHLTAIEKQNIISNILLLKNQEALQKLNQLLNGNESLEKLAITKKEAAPNPRGF